MPIYTADIASRPTVVFATLGDVHALDFINDTFIRSELCSLRAPESAPLLNGNAAMAVRPASADERAVWEHSLFNDLTAGVHQDHEDAIQSNGFAFLVEYREPDN